MPPCELLCDELRLVRGKRRVNCVAVRLRFRVTGSATLGEHVVAGERIRKAPDGEWRKALDGRAAVEGEWVDEDARSREGGKAMVKTEWINEDARR
jgi:hypothetical protein